MRLHPLFVVAALALASCGKGPQTAPGSAAAPTPDPATAPTLLISPEDLRTVGAGNAQQGPVITGSIQPERRADLRAEVSAVVLQVLKDNGEAVRTGDLLVKLDDTSIRDSLASAEESQRAAGQAFDQAERQVQRLKTLQAQGMSSMQALEDAEVRRNTTQSDLAAAKARVVAARQQLQRTLVRSPFDGVVSERKVSAGDTAQVGKELVKVIDPRSMRLEGSVSADHMHEIAPGQAVHFRVNGYPDARYVGKVRRVDASADPTTRQVEVLVSFADPAAAPRVAGLYAEGRIAPGLAGAAQALALPESAIVREAGKAYVWRLNGQALAKAAVELGARDARTGEYPLRSGLAAGDRILRTPSGTLVDGQKIELAGSAATASVSASAATGASAPAPSAATR